MMFKALALTATNTVNDNNTFAQRKMFEKVKFDPKFSKTCARADETTFHGCELKWTLD